jgi:hypothetical protein
VGGGDPRSVVLQLQRRVGNRALQRLLKSPRTALLRDLSAYNRKETVSAPGLGGFTVNAEAPGIRAALADLIRAGKVEEVRAARDDIRFEQGNKSWFAANHHRNAQLDEIREALATAGYARADKMARALYDIHAEYFYSSGTETYSRPHPIWFWKHETETRSWGPVVGQLLERSLTQYEIRQARRVFKNAIDYNEVTIKEGSLSAQAASAGGYARTIGNTINLPAGGSRKMGLLIHELTHVWQYQRKGWVYAPQAIWAQVTEGYSYTSDGQSPDDALREARRAGKTLYDYNLEQQGDILEHYFLRLQKREDVSAYEPFVGDVH